MESTVSDRSSDQPWYRRKVVWLVLAAFGLGFLLTACGGTNPAPATTAAATTTQSGTTPATTADTKPALTGTDAKPAPRNGDGAVPVQPIIDQLRTDGTIKTKKGGTLTNDEEEALRKPSKSWANTHQDNKDVKDLASRLGTNATDFAKWFDSKEVSISYRTTLTEDTSIFDSNDVLKKGVILNAGNLIVVDAKSRAIEAVVMVNKGLGEPAKATTSKKSEAKKPVVKKSTDKKAKQSAAKTPQKTDDMVVYVRIKGNTKGYAVRYDKGDPNDGRKLAFVTKNGKDTKIPPLDIPSKAVVKVVWVD